MSSFIAAQCSMMTHSKNISQTNVCEHGACLLQLNWVKGVTENAEVLVATATRSGVGYCKECVTQ
jgi:hypothetical protein